MKKIISIALVLVLAFSLLTACGGKDNNSTPSTGGGSDTTPPTSQSGNDTTPSGGESATTAPAGADTSTPDGVFAAVGLNIADVTPAGTTDFNIDNDSTSTGVQFWLRNTTYADFDEQAYIDTLWEVVKAASDDGEIYHPYKLIFGEKENYEKTVAGQYNTMDQWGYLHNGNGVNMTLGIVSDMPPDSRDDKYYLCVSIRFNV